MKTNDFQIAPNFNLTEVQSPDTGEVKVSPQLMGMLQHLRDKLGSPLIITSGYRTPEHNRKSGGAKDSYHLRGLAADVRSNHRSLTTIQRHAYAVGFGAAVIYSKKGFIHLDLGKRRTWKV